MRTTSGLHGSPRPGAAAGFSLAELLVTVIVVVEILIIAGLMFDLNNRTATVQTQLAETQQSLRVAQREIVKAVRSAGRAGLPANVQPPGDNDARIHLGVALAVDDNVPEGTEIIADEPRTRVVAGTDVLRIRGTTATPIYQLLNAALGEPNLRLSDEIPGLAESGEVDVLTPSESGFAQDLRPLLEAPEGAAMILVSPLSDTIYAVVSVTGVAILADPPPGRSGVTVSFAVPTDETHPYRSFYDGEPNLPSNLGSAAYLALLEEHVYYVRESFAIPGDPSSDLKPKLARVRLRPGFGTALEADDTGEDIADNIVDLQIALGYNSSLGAGGFFDRDDLENLVIDESATGEDDDWLFNGEADNPENSPWAGPWAPQPELYYVRVTTLGRTSAREFRYISPPIERIENRIYDEEFEPAVFDPDRAYHRRMLRTIVDLRNL